MKLQIYNKHSVDIIMVQTRKNVNRRLVFEESTDSETDEDYVPSSEESESETESEINESESESDLSTDSTDDSTDDIGVNEEKAYEIVSNILKDKYKIYNSDKFTELLNRVGELDPDVTSILNSEDVKDKYKIKLCEMYSILLSQDLLSVEWIEIRNLLKTEIKNIQRKMCMFKDVSNDELAIKMSEFKAVKEKSTPSFKEQIILLDTSIENKKAIYKKYKEMSEFSNGEDYAKMFVWLQYATSIPYNKHINVYYKYNEIYKFLMNVYEKLNQEFHGMKKVKEQILLYLNIKLTNPNTKGFNLALLGEKGVGKCFALNTKVLMANGTKKMIQDVNIGDELIGPSSTLSRVKHLVRGHDVMYNVAQLHTEPYTVCKGHILTLKCDKHIPIFFEFLYSINSYKIGERVYNIPVETFYSFPNYLRDRFVSINSIVKFKSDVKTRLDIPSYLLGMWYGNDKTESTDFDIASDVNLCKLFKLYCASFKTMSNFIYDGTVMNVNFDSTDKHSLKNRLIDYGTFTRFRIPREYKCASIDEKLKFVAGVVDSCGVVNYKINEIIIELCNGDETFFNDLLLIVRSVGLYGRRLNTGIKIYGSYSMMESIPTLIYTREYNKDCYKRNKIEVTKSASDFYYGFELTGDSNNLFLLDDLTVVHNCFAKHTLVRMFDGTVKQVENIVNGDELIGDDTFKRVVKEVTNGQEMMYDVIQSNGKKYTVNESHILSLCIPRVVKFDAARFRVFSVGKDGGVSYKDVSFSQMSDQFYYIDIDIPTYLSYGNDVRKHMYGYKKPFYKNVMCEFNYSDSNLVTLGLISVLNQLEKTWVKIPNNLNVNLDTNYFKFDFEVRGFKIFKYFRCIDIDVDINSLVLTSQIKQHMLLMGVILGYLNDSNTHSIDNKFDILFNALNVDKKLVELDLQSFLFTNDYKTMSDIKVVPTTIDTYYGFTLDDSSSNRRFLLDDGTVVHNTHISRTLADILKFPFEQISMGNVNNPEILTGHHSTYIGSKPGIIVDALINMKYNNGIIFLDEFDKITNPAVNNSMLHIVDPTQNSGFVDNYLGQDIKIDLSNIWFIFAMNAVPECGPLKDRLFIIELEGYSVKDKIEIARNFLLKRICKNAGIADADVTISVDACNYFINKISTGENASNPGVRYIEQALTDVVNKIVFLVNTSSQFVDMSFSIKTLLKYPVDISFELIDKLIVDKPNKTANLMYI